MLPILDREWEGGRLKRRVNLYNMRVHKEMYIPVAKVSCFMKRSYGIK